ncbi:COX15/CtaA family protein [Synechococcus elongatus]|uniref:Cytochrome aa3 controlling protein n=2 Tax=Synechococcus elongatus TaxID=32046 RepID=Q31JY8_SYNE7|nr:COX15/CtaA family protein [Synechococcus elongatus]ABB58631.1 putative cytochrome aa3 controlling protein [Synechococcus elongatus PCC 7942 = FACHB-805]AJD56916.1 cytochrome C oxidase subunit I [Synechococcus elongatus UTEX 2973]MBD2587852.1 heme A synthase [Synechococcus elongatus FACHB-242]MBD2688920.1 heme A synthase [Synechococcus elongatus FACHB-1061]MBD2707440.1 heme A synthase [Synechococcus elongatus PCC 7942 = FACHB-805]
MTVSIASHLQRFSGHLAIATWLLIGIGGATRVMNAGLACPDWPLCYGSWLPWQQFNLQVFLEWFHRLDAAVVGCGTLVIALVAWRSRSQLPRFWPWAATGALLLVGLQATLGALTVTELLRFDLVTAHLGTALLFFVSLLGLQAALQPRSPLNAGQSLPRLLLLVTAIAVYGQCLLGALVGSRWALHQCLAGSQLCTVLQSHLWGIAPTTLLVISLSVVAWLRGQHRWASQIAALLGLQLLLGWGTYFWHLQIEPLTIGHQMVGAALLGWIASAGFRSAFSPLSSVSEEKNHDVKQRQQTEVPA